MNFELAEDALQSVVRLPASPAAWQRLCRLVDATDPQQKAVLAQQIEALVLTDNNANWLRFSALAYLTRNADYFVKQSAFATAGMPADVLMTFIGLVWYHALVRLPTRQQFVDLLQQITAVQLQRHVAQALPVMRKALPAVGAKLRIAIYTPQIVSPQHGGTLFTLNLLSVLAKLGMECQAFAAQEVDIPLENTFRGGSEHLVAPVTEPDSLKLGTEGSMLAMMSNSEFSLDYRFVQVQHVLAAYNPDLVIFVGFYSPMIHNLYCAYPVISLSVHALPPLVPADIWLSADPQGDTKMWNDLPAPQLQHYPFRFWPADPVVPVARSQLQIADTATVLITSGYRLAHEMPLTWLRKVQALVVANEKMHFLLVGLTPEQHPEGLLTHPRIHRIEPQTRLEAWLLLSDIYLNPPRTGGGGSVAMAMEQGLPVLTMSGGDGSDKVRSLAVTSMDAYFDLLEVWVSDAPQRQQAGQQLKHEFHARLDISSAQASDGLQQACRAAIASFNLRREKHNV